MSSLLDKSVVTAIGEHAVFVELLRRGFDAYLAQGPNQPGWDIVVVSERGRLWVQVKATQLETIQIDFTQDFHCLVVVLVNDQGDDKDDVDDLCFHIFSKTEAEALASAKSDTRKDKARTIYVPKTKKGANYKAFREATDRWSKIAELALKLVPAGGSAPPSPRSSQLGGVLPK